MGGNGAAMAKTWEEVRRTVCEIAERMNEPGSAFVYECKSPVAGDAIGKEDSFVVIRRKRRIAGE